MAWLVLIVSGLFEAVWAVALSKAEGFTKLFPSIVFLVALSLSMSGLAWAIREIPVGTGYTVWVGVGAGATVLYAMCSGAEAASLIKIVLLLGLLVCIIGLKLVSHSTA